ncbi:transposase [Spirochaetia bacterium]|nr:transposase [Spirochaetia bacterium]
MDTSQHKYTRAFMIRGACEGLFKVRQVSERLNITERRVKQLKANYRKIGDKAFVHGNTGRIPFNRIPEETRKKIIGLKAAEPYTKANFTHFTEILAEYDITYSYTSIRNILIAAGHQSPKRRRPKKDRKAHPPRARRESFGEMLQADASPFEWLGAGSGELSLHGYIDDATGSITGLYLCKNECLLGYLEVTRQTIENYGVPSELYPDKASVFFVNAKNEKLTVEEQLEGLTERKTQLGRIMDELGVHMHPAHSPQAKGRIERLWETLQSRLPIELAKRNIHTIEQANEFLPIYIRRYNEQFAVNPVKNQSVFVKLYDNAVLDTMLSVKIERKTDSSGVFSFHNHKFIIPDTSCRSKKIMIIMSEKMGFKAMVGNQVYNIEYADFFNNRQVKTHMPEVTRILIDKYLQTHVKETNKGEFFNRRAGSW